MEAFELPVGPVVLRPWRDDDADATWAALQDREILLWNSSGSASRDAVTRFLRARADWSGGDHASWAVVDAATGELLGSVSLHSIDREQGDAEIGYWTVPAARGRGVAPLAVDAVCRWAFGALPIDRIELCHAVENPASGRVAEKAGFRLEGRLRRSYRYGDGVKHDELLWARLSDDPPPAQQPQLIAAGAVSGSTSGRRIPSAVCTGRPSRAQYSNPPIISRTR